ncbi:RNA-directed DNA polymerase, eukaryota, reverse transcriptase zinc-binding domain protein [Tanacetum coccineum]
MPPALTSKGLWTVCAPYGRLVDAFIANKLSKGGKRFGFIRFIGVKDANVFVKTLSNIWIGSYHIFITPAINQRSNPITNPKPQTTNPTQSFNNPSIQNAFPILNTNVTKNTIPATKAEQPKPNTKPSHTNPKRIITFNDQDLINVINTDSILLVKLKDIDSMSNMYTICRNEGFSDLNIHHVGGYWIWIQFPSSSACSKFQENESLKKLYSVKRAPSSNFTVDERILWIEISGLPLCAWGSNAYKKIACSFGKFLFFEKEDLSALSSGRVCISSKSQGLISENVQVEINNELFEATVQEIGSWCIKIIDDYIDLSSNDNIKDVDTSSESIDDHSVDDLEYIQTNLNNIVNQVSEQKMDNNEENKQGEEDIHLIVPQQPPKEEANNKESNPECNAESSDLSRPPGFEFMKKNSSPSSKCSTSFSRFKKKDIKGVSLIHELNQIIDVGNSLGYDVRVVERGKEESAFGSKIFALNTIMARGRSGGLISMWDPNFFSKESIWCDDSFIIIKGNWKNRHKRCQNEQERIGFIFNNIEADYFNPFIDATGLVDLPIGGRCFTWMNKIGTKLSKLDRFLISEDVIDLLPNIHITALDRIWSDHNPILLHVDKINFGPSPFKLYNSWLLRDGFDDLIKSEWDSLDSNNSGFSIKSLEELSSIEKKINEGSASPSNTENRLNLLHELKIIDKFASMDLIQKARVKWDIEGDENTKFFHGMDHDYLERLVTHEEIKEAVWDCDSSKAPGPDGFSFAFVKKSNSSFFTLTLKVNNPTLINDFRPISFIGIHYKIIAKILANRLSKVIDKIVSKEQSTFIARHHILDSLGFGLKWRSRIKTCLSSSRASILVNGSPTSEFSINRGLKQGDPLSPFLFILVMEGLHNAFADAVGNGLISGIYINNSSINISHLFSADDVIITTGWNARDLENIIRVLHVFYLASGLKINIHKSNIYGIGVNEDEVYNMASNAGCIAGNIPFNYLGLPIGSNLKSIASWKMIIDCFRSRLSTWKASLLSIGGHLTLIKSVLGSLSIYYLSIFRAPESVLNDLERIQLFTSPNNLWVKVVKAFHGHEGGFDNNGCSFKGTWANIVGSSNFIHSKEPILVFEILLFFRDLLNEIGQLNIVASEDTCVWNLGPNGTFTVNDARNIIDQKTLPSTSWDKIIPLKLFLVPLAMLTLNLPIIFSLNALLLLIYGSSCIDGAKSPFVQALSFENAFKELVILLAVS